MVYDMENFLGTCVVRYQQCTGSKEIKESCLPYLPGEEQASVFNQATKNGLNPDLRTLPLDYNEWLKANNLTPVEWDIEEDYDDQWMIKHCSKHSVEHGSQKPSTDEKPQPKSMSKDGSDLTAVG